MVINDLLNGMIQVEGTFFFKGRFDFTLPRLKQLWAMTTGCVEAGFFAFGIHYPVILKDSGAL